MVGAGAGGRRTLLCLAPCVVIDSRAEQALTLLNQIWTPMTAAKFCATSGPVKFHIFVLSDLQSYRFEV